MTFEELPAFVRGYIEAMFFTEESSTVTVEEWIMAWPSASKDGSIPKDVGFSSIHSDSLTQIIAECAHFQGVAQMLLSRAYVRGYDAEQAGRDFWFTRNGHGVGYWDRRELGASNLGKKLTDLAHKFGEVSVYLGDDLKVYHQSHYGDR